MNHRDQERRDAEIERLHYLGMTPSDIANRVHLKVDRVRDILAERGLLVPRNTVKLTEGIWGGDQETLRRRIWERQRDGARAALKAMRS